MILKDANRKQLEEAAAHNHRQLFYMNASSLGGEVKTTGGLAWTYAGPTNESMIPFPSLEESNAGAALDEMMTYYRAHTPKSAGCWSLISSQPADLGVKLLARGFQPGWRPNWMALDMKSINTNYASPTGLQVLADNDISTHAVENLPYNGNDGAITEALLQAHPEQAQRFLAVLNGEIVGQSCVFFSDGEFGAAGLYNVGVIPNARRQGIGKAVVTAACLYAKQRGYRYAVLNGTGKRMYEQIGFRWVNDGITWWLMNKNYLSHPPSIQQVLLAESVGKSDLSVLNDLASQFNSTDLNTPITNGMTLMQLAVHLKQRLAAEWLLQHGAELTALDAWGFGWKERAASLLSTHSREINRLYGPAQATLLHIASERNDIDLAQLALSCKPDLEIRDKTYDATALGWAEHLQRKEIAGMIKKYLL